MPSKRYQVLAVSEATARKHNYSNTPNDVLLETNSLVRAKLTAMWKGFWGDWVDVGDPWVHDTQKK